MVESRKYRVDREMMKDPKLIDMAKNVSYKKGVIQSKGPQ